MTKSPKAWRSIGAAFAAACAALTLTIEAQTLSRGEVRLSSRPYQLAPTLRMETRLVQLDVVVRDPHGRAIVGLTQSDFAIYDAGKSRDLATFSVDVFNLKINTDSGNPASPSNPTATSAVTFDTPPSAKNPRAARCIALLFDDINTPIGDLGHAKTAANRFVREALATGDRIAVFVTSGSRTVEFSTDSTKVLAEIANVQSHSRMPAGGIARCPRLTAYEAYQIVSNDPSTMKAKVDEACRCGGQSCDLTMVTGDQLLNPTSRASSNAYEGGTLSTIIDSVRAQAQQTWDQARQSSQSTLDSIKSVLEYLSKMQGTRMLLLASSGFLSGSLDQEQDSIVNEAVRAGIVVNSLDAKGLYAEAPSGPINESNELSEIPVSSTVFQIQSLGDRLDSVDSALARLAESTGGLLFRNNNDLDLGFRQLGIVPSCTYLLGFTPAEDGKYHKVKVELKSQSHRLIQVRPGYFAPTKASSEQHSATEHDTIDAEMRGSAEKAGLAASISEKLGKAASGSPQLTIQTRIDVQKLPFDQQKDRRFQKLTFTAGLFDPQGNFVTGKQAEMDLALKPESFDRFSKTGISGVMQFEIAPGTYRLRMVVQEGVHGSLAATSKDLQIP